MNPADEGRFAAQWLALREPIDHRSRAHALAAAADHYLRCRRLATPTVVDLGTGTGSNLRYLQARLGGPLRWRLLDRDAGLLASIDDPSHERDTLTTQVFDLAGPLEPAVTGATLVTASALLDLASRRWIERMCEACATAGAAVLMALSVDGRVVFDDPDPQDTAVLAAVARDQRRDKSLGPAAGASAPQVVTSNLRRLGYRVTAARSDWHLGAADAELARTLVAGWRQAATRQQPDAAGTIIAWAGRRVEALLAGHTRLTVGHVDVLGLPGSVA